jgi:hypothetical protein
MELNPITLPGEGHVAINLEAMNAIEEHNEWVQNESGRTRCLVEWRDANDNLVYLTGYRGIEPKTQSMSEADQKPWTYYHMSIESRMPGHEDQKFYFTSRAHEDRVWIYNAEGQAVPSKSHDQHLEYMNIVVNALRQRPTRVDTSNSVRLFAFDRIMTHDNVRTQVERLDDGTRNATTIERILDYVLHNEPVLKNDRDLIVSEILDQKARLIADGATPESDPV